MPGMGMGVGVALAPRVAKANNPPSFSPASLFGSSDLGSIVDLQNMAMVWQNSTATTPGTVDQPVGCVFDRSGRGNHYYQSDEAKRPTLRRENGKNYLEFTGSQHLATFAPLGGAWGATATIAAAFRLTSLADSPNILEVTDGTNRQLLCWRNSIGTGLYSGNFLPAPADMLDHVQVAVLGEVDALYQDADAVRTGDAGSMAPSSTAKIVISGDANGSETMRGRWWGGLVINRALTEAEVSKLRTYLGGLQGRVF